MKGNNELHLNQATMIEAVQHYLEKIMIAPVPVVKQVKQEQKNGYADIFIIEVGSENESTIGPA